MVGVNDVFIMPVEKRVLNSNIEAGIITLLEVTLLQRQLVLS